MIQLRNICLSYGSQKIFDSISATFNDDQHIGLVGDNGSGKSTLFKVIVGSIKLDEGSVAILNKKKLAYMPQEVVLLSDKSVLEEALTALEALASLKEQEQELLTLIEEGSTDEHVFNTYADICEKLEHYDVDAERAQVQRILAGLGFTQEKMNAPVASLSVGWKMRLVLAKLLIQKADFYLFDEPTNHLDIFAKEWFLKFLKTSSFGFLLVSHERYFLDELCTNIFELERGKGTMYKGNYSSYVVQKQAVRQLQWEAYVQQQKDIKRKEEVINRFKASASRAKSMQSMVKSLERIERVEAPVEHKKKISLRFGAMQQSGKVVLKVKDLAFAFGENRIFNNVNFEIERGQRVALVAANGVGKTTLFNVIAGIYPKQQGSIEFGYNVKSALFEQDQLRALNQRKTILQEVSDACSKKTESEVRACLGAFLFPGEDTQKKISVLSGGERNRVAMVKVLLQDANFLMLDEPTNHLDITSKEILLESLKEYPGTILFVSHDRDFVNELATDIIELTPQGAYHYEGNYDSFVYQKEQSTIKQEVKHNQLHIEAKQSSSKEDFERSKTIKKLENKIEKISQSISEYHLKIAQHNYGSSEYTRLIDELKQLEHEREQQTQLWESMQHS